MSIINFVQSGQTYQLEFWLKGLENAPFANFSDGNLKKFANQKF